MSKYYIVKDEWYPVYSVEDATEWPTPNSLNKHVDDSLADRYKACMEEFDTLQRILKRLYNEG